jgi:hypothetical protein
MKHNDDLLKEAKKKYSGAKNDLEALNKYSAEIYEELLYIQDRDSKRYAELLSKYHKIRQEISYKFNNMVEQSSFIMLES